MQKPSIPVLNQKLVIQLYTVPGWILEVLDRYNKRQRMSDSQVDIVAHSMGGLIARGLCQQNGYKA